MADDDARAIRQRENRREEKQSYDLHFHTNISSNRRMRKLLLLFGLIAAIATGQTPAPEIPDSISIEKNISYDKYPETVLDILQLKEGSKDKRPGVLCIHGGGWEGGTKETFVRHCLPFVNQGFVVANVEYRLAKAAPAPAPLTMS